MSIDCNDILVIPRTFFLKGLTEVENDVYIIELGISKKCKQIRVKKRVLDLLLFFRNPAQPKQAAEILKLPLSSVMAICHKFYNSKILERFFPVPEHFQRYDRNLLYYNLLELDAIKVQKHLSNLSIGVLGMGGIGNWVSLSLIGLGLKSIKLLDYDEIELSNLNRQILFKEEDIGSKKIDVAKRELQLRNHQTSVEAVNFEILRDTKERPAAIDKLKKEITGLDFLIVSALQFRINQANF